MKQLGVSRTEGKWRQAQSHGTRRGQVPPKTQVTGERTCNGGQIPWHPKTGGGTGHTLLSTKWDASQSSVSSGEAPLPG